MSTTRFTASPRRAFVSLLGAAALAAFSFSPAAFSAVTEGKEYKVLQQQQTEVPAGKIEVIEFFSYGCPHCADMAPSIDAWKKKLPSDVVFTKIPISWGRAQWQGFARVFYTLDAMGKEAEMSADVFQSIHKGRINLSDSKIFFDWAEKKGLDRKKVEEMYSSFTVNSKVSQADKKAEIYKVQSVPRFYVNGRYEVNTDVLGTISGILGAVDEVIVIARTDTSKKK